MTTHTISETNQPKPNLATNLQSLLREHALSISELAEILNLPTMTIRRLISGETLDPRFSTLKLIADHFSISIDALTGEQDGKLKAIKTMAVPLLSWDILHEVDSIRDLNLATWENWQSLPSSQEKIVGANAFGLVSRPAMYMRFPKGTVFIIDPDATPTDGDIVLVHLRQDNEMILRKLFIDPPHSELQSITSSPNSIRYNKKEHDIKGINILTLLYNRNNIS
jgi:transcriptional regulator with XRE-family HTH domain